jgi:hypothetical protein
MTTTSHVFLDPSLFTKRGKKWLRERKGKSCVGTVQLEVLCSTAKDTETEKDVPILQIELYHNGKMINHRTLFAGDTLNVKHFFTVEPELFERAANE